MRRDVSLLVCVPQEDRSLPSDIQANLLKQFMKDYIMSTFSVLSIWNVLWPNCMTRSILNWLVFFMLFLPMFSALNYQSLWILIVTSRELFLGLCIIFCWIVCRIIGCKVRWILQSLLRLNCFDSASRIDNVEWIMQFHFVFLTFLKGFMVSPYSIWRNN